jgi:DNA-binding SARP family transcriptional activator
MTTPPPFLFSLLNLPLLAGMIMFIVIRRPRQLITWAFAGVMAGLIVFYLADVVLYRPGISVQAGLVWQFILNQGANLTILSALAVNLLLRDRRLARWEWAIVGFVVLHMAVDIVWLAGFVRPVALQPCLNPTGLPRLTCPPGDRLAIAASAFSGALVVVLFVSTAYKAAEPRRRILRRYILGIALLIGITSVSLQMLVLTGRDNLGVIPTGPTTLFAIVLGLRMFLALEEAETGVRFPAVGWRIFVWSVALLIAVLIDLTWGILNAPVWTLVVLAAGMAGGGAMLINALARSAATAQTPTEPLPSAPAAPDVSAPLAAPSSAPAEPLRIYLLGPMRVVRDGETLPNTTEVWRSNKTRSLLAYLALRREAGATQIEIVDALWPVGGGLDTRAESNSLATLRSYLSTLRRVLDPAGPRSSDRWIVREGERYTLRGDGLWVDVWQFEALASQAEALLAQHRWQEGLACWQQAVALYAPEGLLPDESYLPTVLIEPVRESLRQRWLHGLRCQARAEQDHARAVDFWEIIHQAEPLDQEATVWLIEHHRGLGNANGLRMVLQRHRDAEVEMNML